MGEKLFGTINFTSTGVRSSKFGEYEVELIELMADSIGSFVKAKIAAEEKELQEQNMYAMAKLSSLGEMAGGIAHEINNPLAIISVSSKLIAKQLEQKPEGFEKKVQNSLEQIDMTVERITKIIEGMKQLIKGETGEDFALNDLNKIAESSLALSEQRFENCGVRLSWELKSTSSVRCSPTQVSQILINLTINSLHATLGTADGWVKVSTSEDEGSVYLAVTDSGLGLNEVQKAKLFQPFFSTKRAGLGTGLGLSLSKKMANLHGGDLQYDHESENTKFVLQLPKPT